MESTQRTQKKRLCMGDVARNLEEDSRIDAERLLFCTQKRYIKSHFEGYAFTIQEQEISTKYLVNKRNNDALVILKCNWMFRQCHISVKDITHMISSYSRMSSRYYLSIAAQCCC